MSVKDRAQETTSLLKADYDQQERNREDFRREISINVDLNHKRQEFR